MGTFGRSLVTMDPNSPTASTGLLQAIANGNPLQALSSLYSTAEFRTNFTPPVVVGISGALSTSGPGWLVNLLQPTLILSGGAGTQAIAPGGNAGDGTLAFLGVIAGIMGVGFLFGRLSK